MSVTGYVDALIGNKLLGWAWNSEYPAQRVTVTVMHESLPVAKSLAQIQRPDLLSAGYGDGNYGFSIELPNDVINSSLRVFASPNKTELNGSPFNCSDFTKNCLPQFLLQPGHKVLSSTPDHKIHFKYLLVDTTACCNARCIYCPNEHNGCLLSVEEFSQFYRDYVSAVDLVQFGCGHEPTLHPDLPEFLAVASKGNRKSKRIQMITNGSLLHRHDYRLLQANGLDELQVSLDSSDEATARELRPGADLKLVIKNVTDFKKACPNVDLTLSSVVNSRNYEEVLKLILFGQSLGASTFIFREIKDHTEGRARNQSVLKMIKELSLQEGQFDALKSNIKKAYPRLRTFFVDKLSQ